ncbi:EAL and HDOD domain-containing protein [Marinobacterium stanieri]|uniref:Diguanylate phosphodiesterase n=1 Tax=Marinobacterium stanieri TaxID=49186 RepID=A0A1N6PZ29_9GAMM|nr:HDOD domain-containing protein [Marinobacterium stanieri]SIQ09537.1 diguanylate phosphodiesterase [Marinobacterium stanieri]
MPAQILMARQPIFNQQLKVVAYELLYRNNEGTNPLPLITGDQASSRVILHSYTSVTEAGNLRVLPAFVNFTQQMLEQDSLPNVPPKEIVVEILEDCLPTSKLVATVRKLAEAGYTIALDDFIYSDDAIPLLEIARIVKIDLRALPANQLAEQVERLKPYNVRLLAEKVETHEEYAQCRDLGFDLFQGYFFSKPQLLKGSHVGSSKLILLQLMGILNQPQVEFSEIEALIGRDPGLTYKLLRLVNSSAFGLKRQVSSIQDTLVYLGLHELKKWLTLIAMADNPGKPSELIRQLLLLARMSELTAQAEQLDSPGEAFMCGLLLHLDGLLDMSTEDALAQIQVGDHIRAAVMDGEGAVGELVHRVEAFVRGTLASDDRAMMSRLHTTYMESLQWTRESMQLMQQANS